MAPPELLTSCFEQCCPAPPKLSVINLSEAASVHCFIVCIGSLLLPWKSIWISHRPALRVGRSRAKAGAANKRQMAITLMRKIMACTPSQMRCDECSNGADAGKVRRLNGDEVAFDHMTIMHVERVAKHLLNGVEAIDCLLYTSP